MTSSLQQCSRDVPVTRRHALGLSIASLLAPLGLHAEQLKQQQRACILVWLGGAPSQMETWDPKPGRPTQGEFDPISTSADGIQISEIFPQLAKQMHAHSELSPHQAGADQLRAAAQEQERIATYLQDKIFELGGECQESDTTPKEGQNHWARVVHDLADSQALTQKYNEQAIYWDPDVPDAAVFFLTLEGDKQRLNAVLRDLAVRADPHAID